MTVQIDVYHTPDSVKRLLKIITGFTLFCFISNSILVPTIGILIDSYLAVTSSFRQNYWIWQPLTSILFYPIYPLSLNALFDFSFNLLVIWSLGRSIWYYSNTKSILMSYLGSGITACLILALFLAPYEHAMVYGMTYGVLGLVTLWSMFNPEEYVWLFFLIRIQAKWILAVALSILLLNAFAYLNIAEMCATLAGFLFSYCYGLFALDLSSPFHTMRPLDRRLRKIFYQLQLVWQWQIAGRFWRYLKVKQEKDEELINSMLEKVSQKGLNNLNWIERQQLNWMSLKQRWRLKYRIKK